MTGHDWPTPFNYVLVRTGASLRATAAPSSRMQEGEKPLFRLAQVMEQIFELWDDVQAAPQFKAENWYHNRTVSCLTEAAQVAAKRPESRTRGDRGARSRNTSTYGMPLTGPGTKPIPPLLHGINANSAATNAGEYDICAAFTRSSKPAAEVRMCRARHRHPLLLANRRGVAAGSLSCCRKSMVRCHHEWILRPLMNLQARRKRAASRHGNAMPLQRQTRCRGQRPSTAGVKSAIRVPPWSASSVGATSLLR